MCCLVDRALPLCNWHVYSIMSVPLVRISPETLYHSLLYVTLEHRFLTCDPTLLQPFCTKDLNLVGDKNEAARPFWHCAHFIVPPTEVRQRESLISSLSNHLLHYRLYI